jgi:hypothetical protein
VTSEESPVTATGSGLFVVELSPSWPSSLSPQHCAAPALVTAHVRREDAPEAIRATVLQELSEQKAPAEQSASVAHDVSHDVAAHE